VPETYTALDVVRELNDGCDGELPVAALAELGVLVGCDITACGWIEPVTGPTLAVLTASSTCSIVDHARA
jgi:hypothetical protein